MEPRLSQYQAQKLALSPQIQQYLKLLPLTTAELHQAIETEIIQNPMLEEIDPSSSQSADNLKNAKNEGSRDTDEIRLGETFDKLAHLDENFRENYSKNDIGHRSVEDAQKLKSFQQDSTTKAPSLSDFLMWQLHFLKLTKIENTIVEEIIGNIDEKGYLTQSIEQIALTTKQTENKVGDTLAIIQDLDPPGIAARDLQEALLLQLKKLKQTDSLAYQIVADHLPLLEKRDWQKIAKKLSISEDKVHEAAKIITGLDPYPGRRFHDAESTVITPDASIHFNDQEPPQLEIEIHDEIIPQLRINHYYRKLLREKTTDTETRGFLRERLQAALNFIRALGLRKSTLRSITEVIAKEQPDFFKKGFSHLRPLRLKDISSQLEIHESTVSRALQNKHISTPQGVIPYKSFFSAKLETAEGEVTSQKSIMTRIQQLVDNEDPKKPLSDSKIVSTLKEEGIVIARRTVAKYRDLLKILPTHLRRKR